MDKDGPSFLLIKVKPSFNKSTGRVHHTPEEITSRFMKSLATTKDWPQFSDSYIFEKSKKSTPKPILWRQMDRDTIDSFTPNIRENFLSTFSRLGGLQSKIRSTPRTIYIRELWHRLLEVSFRKVSSPPFKRQNNCRLGNFPNWKSLLRPSIRC